ncbi:MFS transporter [Marinomonas sp.]|uniref:MFS transporter n=1 Tax=Marinomonas sp. TaxID=1904862 RepID=UPI003C77A56C
MVYMELFSDKPGDEGLKGRERCLAMLAVMTTTSMAVFDGSMVNIALPQIARSLAISSSDAVLISNSYLLSTAMFLAIFAAFVKQVGFRVQFTMGLSVFTLASLGCALSTSLPMLVGMRLLQGVGAAAVLSIAPAILRSIFPNRLLGRILGANALLIATITAIAPVFGGTLISTLSWQWLFVINVPFGLTALLLTQRAMPRKQTNERESFDVLGGVLSAVMLGAFIMTANSFSQAGEGGISTDTLFTALLYAVVSVVAGVLFFRRQKRVAKPLLPLVIFSSTRFSLAALTSLSSFVSQGIIFIALPFLFQNVYGYSAFASALLFTPWPVGIILAAPQAGKFADRYSAALVSTIGLCIFMLGIALLALLPANASIWDIGFRSLLCGIGFGCFQSPNNRELLSNVSRENSGYASGVLAIMRTFGQCLGGALVGVILAQYALSSHGESAHLQMEAQGVRVSLWVAVTATMLAIILSFTRLNALNKSLKEV